MPTEGATTGDGESNGILAGNIVIKGGRIIASGETTNGGRGNTTGINAFATITIMGGTVTATGGNNSGCNSVGICAQSSIVIGGSAIVTATAQEGGTDSFGIWAGHYTTVPVTIKDNAKVTAIASLAKTRSTVTAFI